jgi:L-fucose isomerase-like protein
MKTKVKVIFLAGEKNKPNWPYINYDVDSRAREVTGVLRQNLPEIEFSPQVAYGREREKVEKMVESEKGKYDGYLIYMTSLWTGIPEAIARKGVPLVVADELYSGSGEFLGFFSLVKRENLPVVCVGSSNFNDIIDTVSLFPVLKKMKESRILVVANGESWGSRNDQVNRIKEIFGTDVVRIDSDELRSYYEKTDVKEAEKYKNKWINESLKVVEPDEEEILKSARMHLALKKAMEDKKADAVTVDCLGLYYSGKLFAYPCLSFFQLNNEGSTGVCEGDTDSTITQLLIRHLTGRPAYVSDPVIDTATDQIIYAHCVATNRVYGPDGLANPYIIRSHAEDQKGASVQSIMPLGEAITTIKVSVTNNAFSIHQGRSVGNVDEDRACRTKLAVETDAQKVLDNYHSEIFGWHRVTFYGDYRKQAISLATLYGLKIYQEDR